MQHKIIKFDDVESTCQTQMNKYTENVTGVLNIKS